MAGTEYFRKVPYKQDMPPAGGYPKLAYDSKLPKRGPSGIVIIGMGAATMLFGFCVVARGNQKRRELAKEKKVARLSILPVLQAEQDRWVLKRLKDNLEKEKILMADVEGWEPGFSVYNTERWVPPTPNELVEL